MPGQPRQGRRLGRFCLALLGLGSVPLLASCLASRPLGQGSGAPTPALGSFGVVSTVLGDHTLALAACTSGDREQFLGADLADPASPLVLRLVVDPLDGPAVRVFSREAPFDRSVVFRRADCPVFRVSLEETGWRVNDVKDVSVTLDLDCRRDGERLVGHGSSTHCT